MNKSQLARRLAEVLNVAAVPDCVNFIDAFAAIILESLTRGEPVAIQGLGRFEVKTWRASHLKDFRTGLPVKTKTAKKVKFHLSPAFRERLNGRKTRGERITDRMVRRLSE